MQNVESSSKATDLPQQLLFPYIVWLEWILVNSAGLAIGYATAELLIQRSDDPYGVLIGFVVGLPVGVMQWLVVWRRIDYSFWWLASCVAAWTVGVAISWAIEDIFFG